MVIMVKTLPTTTPMSCGKRAIPTSSCSGSARTSSGSSMSRRVCTKIIRRFYSKPMNPSGAEASNRSGWTTFREDAAEGCPTKAVDSGVGLEL
jgi:hypothetical protein